MGNADAFLLMGSDEGEPATPERAAKLQAVRTWSLSRLNEQDRQFIRGFLPTVTVEGPGGDRLLCFHGSPASFNDIILPSTPEAGFQRLLAGQGSAVLAGGHTHMQQIRRIGDSFFFNPGSVGFAYNAASPEDKFRADPWAEYAVLTIVADGLGLEFRRASFDVAALIDLYRESGRPYADEAAAQYEAAP